MKILIIYGTGEGQTRKISRFMEQVLQDLEYHVTIADANEEPMTPDGFDMVLIGSSIHIHKYQNAVRHYIMDHVNQLNELPTAFFSVCMAVASEIPEEHEEARAIATGFLQKTGWKPQETWHIAGALKYTKYDYFKKLIMRMIAKQEGGSTDTSKDHEYTDWSAVEKHVTEFANNYGS